VSDVILSIENVSKEYQLGTFSAGTFGGDVQRWLYKLLGKEDPFKKIGTNDRSKKTDDEFVLALQDINFEVKRGEVLGIIGKNGAGKSTLLKLLSRVTSPTTGVIRSRGRMASLLEVGTGFHPELTGMENIYLNGAILGMTKAEIKRKLDDIIDFSGVAKYVDTPVKRYSSGMRVRLGFAVAAFLDPEILVVDEVLAVGDAEFQKKAIGKMQDVSRGDGRTVLFVSHNMASVASLCTRGLVLKNGAVDFMGEVEESISHYIVGNSGSENRNVFIPTKDVKFENDGVEVRECKIVASGKNDNDPIRMDDEIKMYARIYSEQSGRDIGVIFQFIDETGRVLFVTSSGKHNTNEQSIGREFVLEGKIPANFFNEGEFSVNVMLIEDGMNSLGIENDLISFHVNPKPKQLGQRMSKSKGSLKPNFKWAKQYV
jgi:lipopolysaccharide transport system ATP-binding protein